MAEEVRGLWSPQPGPQSFAATCPADHTMFGGSRGGGKTDCAIGRQIHGAEVYGPHWNGLVVRRKYKDFGEFRRRIDELIGMGLPAERVGGDNQANTIRFKNGAQISMVAIQRMEQLSDYVGFQFTEITFEEATTFPFFADMVDRLKGSNRSPHGVPCRMFSTGNPGGSGHNAVKQFFRKTFTETRIFIPSFLKDNHILCENDPEYVSRLLSIRDPVLRQAWIDGDWDVYMGQAFKFSYEYHVIPQITEIPSQYPLYFTFDWGYSRPFSCGWWFVDERGVVYRFAEWYGWDGQPNKGLQLTDPEVAEGIKERELRMNIHNRPIMRLCDPTCANRRPNVLGQGYGPSTTEIFARHQLYMNPGDATRHSKIRRFREYLHYELDDKGTLIDGPMLKVTANCKQFIRTIPALAMDEDDPEDIDCFVEGTMISTPEGDVPIESIEKGQLVDTPIGPRPVLKSYISGNAETTTIGLSNGKTLEGTHRHKIFSEGHGLLPLSLLSMGQILNTKEEVEWKLSIEGLSSQDVTAEDTWSAIQHTVQNLELPCYTGRFGKTPLGTYQKAFAYTTKTTTPQTTILKTWNLFLREIMRDSTSNRDYRQVGILPMSLRNGEKAIRVKRFYAQTLKNAVKILPSDNLRALIVANLLLQGILINDIVMNGAKSLLKATKNNVQSAVKNSTQKNTTLDRFKPVVINAVGNSGSKKRVYNITVEQAHLFYANGALTSNTDQEDHVYDEAALLGMARPLYTGKPVEQKTSYDRRIEKLTKPMSDNTWEDYGLYQQRLEMHRLAGDPNLPDGDEYEDGGREFLKSTVE
jgi:hypothetical protein